MKAVILAVVSFLAVCAPALATQCSVQPVNVPKEWITIHGTCRSAMRRQIQMEVKASLQYLAMGAHFSRDGVNRPGFAKLFFDAASEEREHAMKLIDYLLMRGELTHDVTSLIKIRPPEIKLDGRTGVDALGQALIMENEVTNNIRLVIAACEDDPEFNDYHPPESKVWETGVDALEQALMMENEVTKSIRTVIAACEDDPEFNDYHLVDYLTGEFLEEQYKGQRDLAGKATTLKRMLDRHSALGEFLFDKKLLGMDI